MREAGNGEELQRVAEGFVDPQYCQDPPFGFICRMVDVEGQ